MRRFLRLLAEVLVAVGLWMPGLVFTCFAGGRREVLFEVEDEGLVLRDLVEGDAEEYPGLEDLVEGFLPLTDGLMAIFEDSSGSSQAVVWFWSQVKAAKCRASS
jgi:hypothetical protein